MTQRISGLVLFLSALFCILPVAAHAQATAAPSPAPAATKAAEPPAKEDPNAKPGSPVPSPSPSETPGPPFGNMKWREVGPALPGGRVAAVAGSATNPNLYYLGAAGGGVWKSTDGAETWSAVFEKEKVSAIGAVAIDPKDNNVVWVGSGESNPRQDVSYGNGVYKSTDGGEKWTHVGLDGSQHISRILIDPRNTNHVIVSVLGNIYGPSTERGVYITDDGGKTWSKTLYVSDQSGASDIAMNLQNPSVLYAGMWHFLRQPWTFTSGGEDDGLYKSTDGGHNWTRLTGHGLPTGITGKFGLAVAPSNGNRVYAIIENKTGLLFRSDDAGASWTMVNASTEVDGRPFYFTHLEVDPKNPDKIYTYAFQVSKSTDGGKTIKTIATGVHVDFHAMWIAPNDPNRIILGEDGGIARTVDGGGNWYFGRNIPIGQIYRVGVSTHENPYNLCVGLQDNNAWCGPANSLDPSGIQNKNWFSINGGDGEFAAVDPIDPNFIWSDSQGGSLIIYNKVTKDFFFAQPYLQKAIEAYDLSKSKYRFNWESPINFAPWDGHIGWLGGNVVFQTTDRGRHWTVISPDLTLNDKSHQQPSGGPLVHDVSGAEYSDNLLDIEGSSKSRGEIWAGSDDGLVHVTRDGGKHWSNVTPPDAPKYGRVETVAPSSVTAGTAYVNFDGHVSNDFKPYIFVTHDFGKTWKSIAKGIPADQYVRAVRPDLHDRNIVYAGTENGIWISFDGGSTWQDFKNNLPTVSVHDIRFQPEFNDLVIATHGRAAYIMDDMRPVQAVAREVAQGTVLFAPRTAYEYNTKSDDEGTYTDYLGQNPPNGAVVTFYQKTPGKTPPEIDILDAHDRVIRRVKGTHKVNDKDEPYVTNKSGINRYVWDFQIDGPVKWLGAAKERYQGPSEGPQVPPGHYGVRTALGGRTYTQHFDVKADPHTLFTQKELTAAYAFNVLWTHKFSIVDTMLNGLDDLKKQLDAGAADPKGKANSALLTQVTEALAARTTVFNVLTANYQNDEDGLQAPGKLREDVGNLSAGIVTPPIASLANRINPEYLAAVKQYNAYLVSLKPVGAAFQAAGLKTLTIPSALAP
ncbi:MAG: hypothetical protein M3126_02165 [Candidatus Eremiobacteraeota bacterium]|nr:hypothetical protein [Candidatus Eremiobacteraeota bacterium]